MSKLDELDALEKGARLAGMAGLALSCVDLRALIDIAQAAQSHLEEDCRLPARKLRTALSRLEAADA